MSINLFLWSDEHGYVCGRGCRRQKTRYVQPAKLLRIKKYARSFAQQGDTEGFGAGLGPQIGNIVNQIIVMHTAQCFTTYSAHDLHHYPRDTNGMKDLG